MEKNTAELINYELIHIKRAIMHHIDPKKDKQKHGYATLEQNLSAINDDVKNIIKTRLVEAAGHHSKSFDMEIKQYHQGSFFGFCHDMNQNTNEDFIKKSQILANLLAGTQTHKRIPGGFFILLDCEFSENDKRPIYIVIKAEPHQALSKNAENIQVLKDIFLSPSQKFYKIGIIYQREHEQETLTFPNNSYGAYLMDQQFKIEGSTPATYFSKDFLGFSAENNAKLQSQQFYDIVSDFIKTNILDFDTKNALLNELNNLFKINQNSVITPKEFAETYFRDIEVQDNFLRNIGSQFPTAFVKDATLIQGRLKKKKIYFKDNINIIGPDDVFNKNVTFIRHEDELRALKISHDFTIIKIKGIPYSQQ